MALVLNGDGNVTGLTPGGLPDASITQADLAANVAGNGPAFRAGATAGTTSLSAGGATKVNFGTELLDTHNCYSSSRFTPNVAGYYMIGSTVRADNASNTLLHTYIHLNGATYCGGSLHVGTLSAVSSHVTSLVYCNGTTDYIEIAAFVAVTTNTSSDNTQTFFYGFLVKAA